MDVGLSPNAQDKIGLLLQRHCIDEQLYLQHDLNLLQLAKAIGTNRFYLSQYFSQQGTTYNAYINGLRIEHFCTLPMRRPIQVWQTPSCLSKLAS